MSNFQCYCSSKLDR